MIEGTIQPDADPVLDKKPDLPAGRVTVVLRQDLRAIVPRDDPFWQRMLEIWDSLDASGHVPRSTEEIDAYVREMRHGCEERQNPIERLQEVGRRRREAAEQEPQT